jgi:hypothetical protein
LDERHGAMLRAVDREISRANDCEFAERLLRQETERISARLFEATVESKYWQDKYTALVETTLAMKQAGFVRYDGPKKPVLTGEFKQSDEQVVAEAERRFVDKLKDDLVRQGISATDAAKEAARIRREVVTP